MSNSSDPQTVSEILQSRWRSACGMCSQIFSTPQGAARKLGTIPDNIDKASQLRIIHLPTAYLYAITAVAFHGIVRLAVACHLQNKADMAGAPALTRVLVQDDKGVTGCHPLALFGLPAISLPRMLPCGVHARYRPAQQVFTEHLFKHPGDKITTPWRPGIRC